MRNNGGDGKMMPDNLAERLQWARQVIASDAEPDDIGIAAHVVLAWLERIERHEFICVRCGLRKDGEGQRGDF